MTSSTVTVLARIPGAADDRTGEFSLEAGNPVGGIAEYCRPIDAVIARLDRAAIRRAGQHDVIATRAMERGEPHQREIWQRPIQLRQADQKSAGTWWGETHAAQAAAAVDARLMGLPITSGTLGLAHRPVV